MPDGGVTAELTEDQYADSLWEKLSDFFGTDGDVTGGRPLDSRRGLGEGTQEESAFLEFSRRGSEEVTLNAVNVTTRVGRGQRVVICSQRRRPCTSSSGADRCQ
jgi:hypothetical protein